jgi:hypothetical protein
MIACRSSWKSSEFTRGKPIPYKAVWSEEQFSRITRGLIPKAMEDKWFVFFEAPHLFFHRSWTGDPIYKVIVSRTSSGYEVSAAHSAISLIQDPAQDSLYQSELLDFLVSNLLLGESKSFPVPPNAKAGFPPGVFQHAISGTGYSEVTHKRKKPWWRFWK